MKFRLTVGHLIWALLLCGYSPVTHARQTGPVDGANRVIARAGEFVSPNKKCRATLKTSSLGGFLVLTLGRKAGKRIDDVTGIAWVSGDTLVYTTSPSYGIPGVFAYSCDSNGIKRLAAPRTLSKAYPNGADYFELQGISSANPVTVYFYYAPDVDAMDTKNFKTPAYLFQVYLDGTGFKQAE